MIMSILWVLLAVLLIIALGRLAGWCIELERKSNKKDVWHYVRGCIICLVAWLAAIGCCIVTLDRRQLRLLLVDAKHALL